MCTLTGDSIQVIYYSKYLGVKRDGFSSQCVSSWNGASSVKDCAKFSTEWLLQEGETEGKMTGAMH
jgi:hypothetical protein